MNLPEKMSGAVRTAFRTVSESAFPYLLLHSLKSRLVSLTLNIPKAICAAAAVLLLIITAFVPASDGTAYDIRLLYASLNMFFTLLFAALVLLGTGEPQPHGTLCFLPFRTFDSVAAVSVRHMDTAFYALILLVSEFGAMYERFGTGHGFNLLCLLGFLMTVTAACLTRMTLFTFAVGLKLKHSSVRAVFGTVIAVWSLAAMLLSRSHGELPQYAVMLTSPFGTTLPVGGWCTAIIMGICEGSFAAVLPGLLLYPAYILLLVLVLCAMDKEHYDSACLVLLGGNKQVGRSCENRIVCKVREVSAKAASAVGSSGASLLEKLHMPFLAAEYRRIITEKSNSPYLPHGGYSPLSFIFSLFCGIFTAVSGDGKEVLFRVLMISVYIQLFGLLRVQPFEAYTSDIRGLMLRSSAAALTELPAAVFESAVIMSLAALLNGIPASAAVGMAVIRVLIAAAIPFVYNLLQSVSSSRTAVLTFLITAASAVSAFLVR